MFNSAEKFGKQANMRFTGGWSPADALCGCAFSYYYYGLKT